MVDRMDVWFIVKAFDVAVEHPAERLTHIEENHPIDDDHGNAPVATVEVSPCSAPKISLAEAVESSRDARIPGA